MSNKSQSNESRVKKLRGNELQRISKIVSELEPLAEIYERNGTELFKVCFELLEVYRALEKGFLENPQQESKLGNIYRRSFTGTFMGDRRTLLTVAPDEEP